jgi:hypothetical protein
MRFTFLPILLIISLAFAGSFSSAEEVNLPAEVAYQKALNYLLDIGAMPTFRDKELLLIKTDPLPLKLTTEEADCGSMFGIPYLKDKRVKTAVTFQVRVKALTDTSCDVTVNATLDGYMDITENAPFFIYKTRDTTKVLTCKSKGVLERRLIKAVNNQSDSK